MITSSSYKTKDIYLNASATLEKKKKLTEKMATIQYEVVMQEKKKLLSEI